MAEIRSKPHNINKRLYFVINNQNSKSESRIGRNSVQANK